MGCGISYSRPDIHESDEVKGPNPAVKSPRGHRLTLPQITLASDSASVGLGPLQPRAKIMQSRPSRSTLAMPRISQLIHRGIDRN